MKSCYEKKTKSAKLDSVLSRFIFYDNFLCCHSPETISPGALQSSTVVDSTSALALETCFPPLQLHPELSQLSTILTIPSLSLLV